MAMVQKRGNSYRITVSCGYDMTGKQIRKHNTWTPEPGMTAKQTEKELERQKVLFEEKCRTGQVMESGTRFADFADQWFASYAEKQHRPRTVARNRAMMPRINAAIGHIKLENLQPHHLLAFYDNLAEAGIRGDVSYAALDGTWEQITAIKETRVAFAERAGVGTSTLAAINQGKNISKESATLISKALGQPLTKLFESVRGDIGLSSKTILHHHRLISTILTTAVHWQMLYSNPCTRVKPPRVEKGEPRYLDDEEAIKMMALLEGEETTFRVAVIVLLFTGMRRGELLGLEWDDVEEDLQVLHIRRSSLYLPEKGVFTDETKTDKSARAIKTPPAALDAIRELKVWQTEQRLAIGDQWEQGKRIFTAWNGKPMHPDTLSAWFRRFIQKSDLPDISIHGLRHTNATLQIAGGVPITTVAGRLGHASAATTTKIYAHAIQSADAAAAELLQNLLRPNSKTVQSG